MPDTADAPPDDQPHQSDTHRRVQGPGADAFPAHADIHAVQRWTTRYADRAFLIRLRDALQRTNSG